VKENDLKYAYYTRQYLWKELISNDTIDFRGDSLRLPEMIDLYVNCNNAFNLTITEQLVETIYNRIHEIRTRFEVLHRDAIIDYYKEIENNPQNKEVALKTLEEKPEDLLENFPNKWHNNKTFIFNFFMIQMV
jgi:hypothetical protein